MEQDRNEHSLPATGDRKRGFSKIREQEQLEFKRRALDGPSTSSSSGGVELFLRSPASRRNTTCDVTSPSTSLPKATSTQCPSFPLLSLFTSPSYRDVETSQRSRSSQLHSSSSMPSDTISWQKLPPDHRIVSQNYERCPEFDASKLQIAPHTPSCEVVTVPGRYKDKQNTGYSKNPEEQQRRGFFAIVGTGPSVYRCEYDFWEEQSAVSSQQQVGSSKRDRFNLSRYQLDDEEQVLAVLERQPVLAEEKSKPTRFLSQRERIMQFQEDSSSDDASASASPSVASESPSGPLESTQDDSPMSDFISPREKLLQYRQQQAGRVVIPSTWEGEQRLQEWVGFGNIEDALRPLGLMMARAALVSDSAASRHRARPSATGCAPFDSPIDIVI